LLQYPKWKQDDGLVPTLSNGRILQSTLLLPTRGLSISPRSTLSRTKSRMRAAIGIHPIRGMERFGMCSEDHSYVEGIEGERTGGGTEEPGGEGLEGYGQGQPG